MSMNLSQRILLVLVALLLVACARRNLLTTPADSPVTILYTTDTHGRLVDSDEVIGIDRIAAMKKSTANSLLVDAGDYLQGAPIANLTAGKDIIDLMKLAGYNAVSVGNHEFDYGRDVLSTRNEEALTPPNVMSLLTANVIDADGSAFLTPSIVLRKGGLKIGLFGLTVERTPLQTHPKNVAGLVFKDVVATAREQVRILRNQGCDVVIALAHVGTLEGSGVRSIDIASAVENLDVVIDGHSHVVVDETVENGRLVVSSGAHGKNVGELVLTRGPDRMIRIQNRLLTKEDFARISPDEAVQDRLSSIQKDQEILLSKVVAKTDVDLIGERALVRTRETNFGNLCADAIRQESGADIALINGGSIRQSIPKGPITRGDFITALPFTDATVTKTVTGKQLIEILEHGFRVLPDESGSFPQISGLRLVVDIARPAFRRIVSIAGTDGTPIEMHRQYTVVVSDFLASGGDGYPILAELPVVKTFSSVETAVIAYINENGTRSHRPGVAQRIFYRDGAASAVSKKASHQSTLRPAA